MLRLVLAVDQAILLGIRRWHGGVITRMMRIFTQVGDALSWIFTALALIACGGDTARIGLRLGMAAGLAALVAQVFKRSWRRARPSAGIAGFTALAENPDAFSFPSGHAAAAFAVALALAGLVPGAPGFVFLAFAVALSRVYLGAHYPLDVIVGACIGVLCGGIVRMMA